MTEPMFAQRQNATYKLTPSATAKVRNEVREKRRIK